MPAITVATKGSDFALLLSPSQFNSLGLKPNASYEMVQAKPGIWVLTEKEEKKREERHGGGEAGKADEKIFRLLREKGLGERVEGRFEGFLDEAERKRLKELVKEGRVVPFRLSKKYKKAVYKARDEAKGGKKGKGKGAGDKPRESESADAKEKPIQEYCLEKDGFLVCKNDQRARALSQELKERVEEGDIKGIKNFNGVFYIIDNSLYEKYREKAVEEIKKQKDIWLSALSSSLGISKLLAKIVCEFLKDEGEIIEKRKELFQAV